jgi:hypothetical protein
METQIFFMIAAGIVGAMAALVLELLITGKQHK